jgi:dTDP-4-dehydrorhamnose reductase
LRRQTEVISTYNVNPPTLGRALHLNLEQLNEIKPCIVKARPDIVVHTAALTDVDLCEEHPDRAQLVNGLGTGRVAEAAAEIGAYLVYVSTDYVFDGNAGRYREDDSPKPINHYGESKLLGERLVKESSVNHCIARTSVLYGWGRPARLSFATWVLNKLSSNQRVRIVNDQYASPTFNLNLANMILDVCEKQVQGVMHLAGADRVNRYDFALEIVKAYHLDAGLIEEVNSRSIEWQAKRPFDSSLNVEKATTILSSKPLHLTEALEQFRSVKS